MNSRSSISVLCMVACLPLVSLAGEFYGVWGNDLYSINSTSGVATMVADFPLGNKTFTGADYDHTHHCMYVTDNNANIYRVDPRARTYVHLGRATPELVSIGALAYNADDGYLYATQSGATSSHLYRIDPASLAATTVGVVDLNGSGFGYVSGLAYEPETKQLLAASSTGASKLYRLNPSNAVSTLIGDIGYGYVAALAYNPFHKAAYGAAEPFGSQSLLSIDTTSGAGTLIGTMGVSIQGLAVACDPYFTTVRLSGNSLLLTATNVVIGATNYLSRCHDLNSGQWSNVQTNVPSLEWITWTEDVDPGWERAFYRVSIKY